MRIGFYAGGYVDDPDSYVGASGTNFFPLAFELSERGHDVFVLQLTRNPPSKKVEHEGVTFHFEPTLPKIVKNPFVGLKIIRNHIQSDRDQSVPTPYERIKGDAIREFTLEHGLDALYLLHNTNVASYLTDPIDDTKLIINLIGFGIDESQGGARNTFPYQDYIFQRPEWSLHIETTSYLVEKYQSVYEDLSLDSDRLAQLPHCIDTDQFNPEASFDWEEYGINSKSTLLVYPVHVYPGKNIEMGIETLARIRSENGFEHAQYVIAGNVWDEGYFDELQQLADELSVSDAVHFLKGVEHSKMAGFMADADLVLFPSHQETYGIGVVESLCCGTPVVGPSYIPSTHEILQESRGGYASVKTVDSFTTQSVSVLGTTQNRKKIHKDAEHRYGSRRVAHEFVKQVQSAPKGVMAPPDSEVLMQIEWSKMDDISEEYVLSEYTK